MFNLTDKNVTTSFQLVLGDSDLVHYQDNIGGTGKSLTQMVSAI